MRKPAIEEIDLEQVQRVWQEEVYERFAAIKHLLSHKQWLAVYLVYGKGQTQQEAGVELGTSRSAVSGLLSRAHERMAEHDRQLRAEAREAELEYRRKHC
jgi:DNA-directed RNA polymerase specialized sigma subunit